jgi:hypothetical protein
MTALTDSGTGRTRALAAVLIAVVMTAGIAHVWLLPSDVQARLSYDSFRYLAGTESIVEQGRYLDLDGTPQQVWPAGMSLLYAGLWRVTGAPPLELVRWVDLAAYLVLVLSCLGIASLAGMRPAIALAMLAAIVCNGVIVSMQNKLWSDPPGLALLSAMLLALLAAATRPRRAAAFLSAAWALAAAAIMLRYAMLATIPLLMLVALLVRRRLFAVAAPLAAVPAVLAMVTFGASKGSRTFGAQPMPWGDDVQALFRLADQVFPTRAGGAIALAAFVLLCLAAPVVLACRRDPEDVPDAARVALRIAAAWTGGYALFLPIAQFLAYPSFALDTRIFAPLYLGAIIATAAACELLARRRHAAALLLALPLLFAGGRALRYTVTGIHRVPEVRPCTSREEYIAALRSLAPSGLLVSNAQGIVWYALRKPVFAPPFPITPVTEVWFDPARACKDIIEREMPRPVGGTPGRALVIATWKRR